MENKELFSEHISGKDVTAIAKEVGCSKSTVYNHLGGDEPETPLTKRTYELIMDAAKRILVERGKIFLTLENK